MAAWRDNGHNMVLDGGDFFVSYLPDTSAAPDLGAFTKLGAMLGIQTEASETALRHRDNKGYLVLVGDWRKEYEEAAPRGFNACLEVYKRLRGEHASDWTQEDCYEEVTNGI